MILTARVIGVGLACAETVHGILRVALLNPRLGDRRARRVAVFTGSGIIFAIGWFAVPWIGPTNTRECISVGTLWLVSMLAFDVGFGRFVFHFPWHRIAADFDLRKGNLLTLGMGFLFLTPLLVAKLRGLC